MKTEPSAEYTVKHSIEDFKSDYLSILTTQSITGDTKDMMDEIIRQVETIKGVMWHNDEYGNLYVTKGKLKGTDKYPAFVSHTDTVHKLRNTFYVDKSKNGNWYAYTEDDNEFQQVGIGGDDKCGIILCLELMHRLKYGKFAFFLDEESGCKGSKAGDLSFFDDCRYAIQIDRKGNGDIITTGSGTRLCSTEFEEMMSQLGKKYLYAPTTGFNTDVVALKDRGLEISACNLSAGYYNPHSKQEYINEVDLICCLEFCLAIANIKTVYPHKLEKKSYTYQDNRKQYQGNSYSPPPQTSRTVRKCILCQKDLLGLDGKMCLSCVHSNLMLVVQGDKKTLEVQVPIDAIDINLCRKCDAEIVLQLEIENKLCMDCTPDDKCKNCGLYLRGNHELARKLCKWCVVTHGEDDNADVCACGALLNTYTERQSNTCTTCIYFEDAVERDSIIDSVQVCSMNCTRTLTTMTEKSNGICDKCVMEIMAS